MSRSVDPQQARRALAQRLRAAGEVLLDGPLPPVHEDLSRDAAVLLDLLVREVHANTTSPRVWLLYVAVSSAFPTAEDVRALMRQFELVDASTAMLQLLDTCLSEAQSASPTSELVITRKVVVDVDHSARHDLHTGIQQVVRRTVPRWTRDHDVELVAWTSGDRAYRSLQPLEHHRISRWGHPVDAGSQTRDDAPIVVPWQTTLILAEVPPGGSCQRLAALAQFSGNRVSAIGYDCIPIVSAPMVPGDEPNKFALYLSAIKYAHSVAAISISATSEFAGFSSALATQGLPGPSVTECVLPAEIAAHNTVISADAGLPTVLAVGSFEPRKNHLALLFAAEVLWREGLQFRLRLIGGSGWGTDVPSRVRHLQNLGYPVAFEQRVSDEELRSAFHNARFTVFASLHEGFGLPVAESIAAGTPVITSNYGSPVEIGAGYGAVLVDPRNDSEIVSAMRTLITDDARLAELVIETKSRPVRSWDDYAREAWSVLVLDEQRSQLAGDAA